jgi:hypothetical protein
MCDPRLTVISNEDDFKKELLAQLKANGYEIDSTVENWLDSEFNRIYVAYAYADVTNIQ